LHLGQASVGLPASPVRPSEWIPMHFRQATRLLVAPRTAHRVFHDRGEPSSPFA
jgi:hypothetical protein